MGKKDELARPLNGAGNEDEALQYMRQWKPILAQALVELTLKRPADGYAFLSDWFRQQSGKPGLAVDESPGESSAPAPAAAKANGAAAATSHSLSGAEANRRGSAASGEHELFISYSHRDLDFAARLKKDLEEAGMPAWMDKAQLEAGAEWRHEIAAAIEKAKAMVLCISEAAASSRYCGEEWSYGSELNKPLFPVFLKDPSEIAIRPGDKMMLCGRQRTLFGGGAPYSVSLAALIRGLRGAGLGIGGGDQGDGEGGAKGTMTVLRAAASVGLATLPESESRLLEASGEEGEGAGGLPSNLEELVSTGKKPWKETVEALRPASAAAAGPAALPDSDLELDFVYGYRAHGARRNLFYVSPPPGAPASAPDQPAHPRIVYPGAALGIVYDASSHAQEFFRAHDDEVTCLALHPDGRTVATGQSGRLGRIFVWDAHEPAAPKPILLEGFHNGGAAALAFTCSGQHLISVGKDEEHTVAAWAWRDGDGLFGLFRNKPVASAKGDKSMIFGVECSPHNAAEFVTYGVGHLKFWRASLEGLVKGLSGAPAQFGAAGAPEASLAYHSATWADPQTLVAGTQTGELHVFVGGAATRAVRAHQGAVFALGAMPGGGIASGGRDGRVWIYDARLKKTCGVDLAASLPSALLINPGGPPHEPGAPGAPDNGAAVRSIAVRSTGGTGGPGGAQLLLGLASAHICEVDIDTASGSARVKCLLQSHFASELARNRAGRPADSKGELWGLAAHPLRPAVATVCDDGTMRVWDLDARRCALAVRLKAAGACAAFRPDGSALCAGLVDGDVEEFEAGTGALLSVVELGGPKAPVVCLAYSPSGARLAVGTDAGNVHVLAAGPSGKWAPAGVCSGLKGRVRHLDWSADGRYLRADSASYELALWEAGAGCARVADVASLRGAEWASATCTLGWDVQGAVESGLDIGDILAVDRSASKTMLACANYARALTLAQYPCTSASAPRRRHYGHSGAVANARFSCDEAYVCSVGGPDLCVFQWRRVRAPAS
eukprot:tig00020941_g16228.t1